MLYFYSEIKLYLGLSWEGDVMRQIVNFLLTLPNACSRLTYQELLLTAVVLTVGLWFILTISGRKFA